MNESEKNENLYIFNEKHHKKILSQLIEEVFLDGHQIFFIHFTLTSF